MNRIVWAINELWFRFNERFRNLLVGDLIATGKPLPPVSLDDYGDF